MRLPSPDLALIDRVVHKVNVAADTGPLLAAESQQTVPRLLRLDSVDKLAREELLLVNRLTNDLGVGKNVTDAQGSEVIELGESNSRDGSVRTTVPPGDKTHLLVVEADVVLQ